MHHKPNLTPITLGLVRAHTHTHTKVLLETHTQFLLEIEMFERGMSGGAQIVRLKRTNVRAPLGRGLCERATRGRVKARNDQT